jgi:uncharacterized protein YkwD
MRFSTRLFSSLLFGGAVLLTPTARLVHADVPAPAKKAPVAAPAVDQPGAEVPTSQNIPAAPAPATPTPTTPAPAAPAPAAPVPPAPAATQSAPSPGEYVETDEERRFVELVNLERRKRGLNELTIEPLLIKVAREHCREMQEKAYFNHNSPTVALKTPMDRYLKAIYTRPEYACVGENLFYCSIVDVQRGHNAFMNSPTHRDNVLFPRYEKIGVGIVKNERGEFWVTQMFLTNTDPVSVAKHMAKNK